MNVEIITTGTELLLGEIVDTNATYIARELRSLGMNLFYKTTVGDNRRRLADVLRLGAARSDVIIVTGGLGPTVDDITRDAVADASGRPLEQRREIVENLRAMFASWGRTLTENNLRQTFLPIGSTLIPNPIGTAPGFLTESDGSMVICLPGVPREMKRMMADWVVPFLQERAGDSARVLVTRTLHTAGIGESAIDDRITHLMIVHNPTVGLAAHLGRVDVRITASAPTDTEARALIETVEDELRDELGRWIYGADGDTLGSVVANLLKQQSAILAIAETNTAGRIASSFRDSEMGVLGETIQANTLSSLAESLSPDTLVSLDRESVVAVATRLRTRSAADYALVLLGTTEPGQGFWSDDRGETWLGLATPHTVMTHRFEVGGIDEFSGSWLAIYALNYVRRQLLGQYGTELT